MIINYTLFLTSPHRVTLCINLTADDNFNRTAVAIDNISTHLTLYDKKLYYTVSTLIYGHNITYFFVVWKLEFQMNND